MESRATCTGSPTPLPHSGAKTATSACFPTTSSWSTAFGRWRSAATSNGAWPLDFSHLPNLPAAVVLPAPCRPARSTTVGGFFANCSSLVSPPRMPTSSSLTILMTCCAGLRLCETSAPSARAFTRSRNALTTGTATSASSSASRISRNVASTSSSLSRPLPRSVVNTASSRSERASNTASAYSGENGLPDLGRVVGIEALDVERVHDLVSQRRHLRRADVEVAVRERAGDPVEQRHAVPRADLHDRRGLGERVVHVYDGWRGGQRRRGVRARPLGEAGLDGEASGQGAFHVGYEAGLVGRRAERRGHDVLLD